MAKSKTSAKPPGFEEALARLEAIVKGLEDGDLPLEESLRLFEEGVSLTRLCASRVTSTTYGPPQPPLSGIVQLPA